MTFRAKSTCFLAILAIGGIVAGPVVGGSRPAASTGTVAVVEESWPDGQPRLRKQVLTRADGTVVDHGTFVRWYPSGQVEYEAVFVHGKKEGVTVRYHENGRVASRQEYREGKRHGASVAWDASGNKVKEEHWADGKPHGTWTVWKDGEVRWRHTYEHGVPAPLPKKPSSS